MFDTFMLVVWLLVIVALFLFTFSQDVGATTFLCICIIIAAIGAIYRFVKVIKHKYNERDIQKRAQSKSNNSSANIVKPQTSAETNPQPIVKPAAQPQAEVNKQLERRIAELQKQNNKLYHFRAFSLDCIRDINSQFKTHYDTDSFFEAITQNRLNNALRSNLDIKTLSVEMFSPRSGQMYTVSLSSCNCKDYSGRLKNNNSPPFPCKHMLYLAYTLDLLRYCQKNSNSDLLDELNEITQDIKDQTSKKAELKRELSELERDLEHAKKEIEKTKQELQSIIDNGRASYPHLAHLIAEAQTLHYERAAQYLEEKNRPALVEAARIRELREETTAIIAKLKEKEEQLKYLKRLFPNIDIVLEDDFEPSKWFHIEYSDDFKK